MKPNKNVALAAKARITTLSRTVDELTGATNILNERLGAATKTIKEQREALATCYDSINKTTGTLGIIREANERLHSKLVMWRGVSCVLAIVSVIAIVKAVM